MILKYGRKCRTTSTISKRTTQEGKILRLNRLKAEIHTDKAKLPAKTRDRMKKNYSWSWKHSKIKANQPPEEMTFMKVKSNLRQKSHLQSRNTAKGTIKTKRKKLKTSRMQGMKFLMISTPSCLIISSSKLSLAQMLNDFFVIQFFLTQCIMRSTQT